MNQGLGYVKDVKVKETDLNAKETFSDIHIFVYR